MTRFLTKYMGSQALRSALMVVALMSLMTATVDAREFRRTAPIITPTSAPPGLNPVDKIQPVDRRVIEDAIQKLMDAWNTGGLENLLSDNFFDKARLLDAIAEDVPRDARIRILAVEGVQTLQQFVGPEDGDGFLLISVVTAIVRTQVEFDDPVLGFRRLEGRGEYVFEITMRAQLQ